MLTRNTYYDGNGNPITNSTGVVKTEGGIQVTDYGQNDSWANSLDYSQGDNSRGFFSDCGLVACENVLIQEGLLSQKTGYSPTETSLKGRWTYGSYNDTGESTVVNYAVANGLTDSSKSDSYLDGGTTACQQWDILKNFGVPSNEVYTSLTGIANAIMADQCVIAEVDAYKLWGIGSAGNVNHSVTVTGVAYDYTNPNQIDGFYICDSGAGMVYGQSSADKFVSYSVMASSFDLSFGGTAGLAIITDNAKQILSAVYPTQQALTSSKGLSASTLNNVIQNMAGYVSSADAQVCTAFVQNQAQQNLANLVASHTS